MIKQGSENDAAPQNLVVVQNWHEELNDSCPAIDRSDRSGRSDRSLS
jgi:hypothetical protein